MRVISKLYVITFVTLVITSCAWYKGPPLQPNANATLDGSALDESSGPGFFKTIKSAENYGASDTGYADNGGNYDVSSFDNVT
jgi:hypothetical protein